MHEMTTTEKESEMGLDGIIAKLDSYIKNPKLATAETLIEIKNELIDLKEYLDGEDNFSDNENESGGLSIIISKMKNNKGEYK